eukprot:747773-Hanusia_phi.AAC.9
MSWKNETEHQIFGFKLVFANPARSGAFVSFYPSLSINSASASASTVHSFLTFSSSHDKRSTYSPCSSHALPSHISHCSSNNHYPVHRACSMAGTQSYTGQDISHSLPASIIITEAKTSLSAARVDVWWSREGDGEY